MGTNTYRLMYAFTKEGEPGTDVLGGVSKVVFSSTLTDGGSLVFAAGGIWVDRLVELVRADSVCAVVVGECGVAVASVSLAAQRRAVSHSAGDDLVEGDHRPGIRLSYSSYRVRIWGQSVSW